jgi:hypothetical protein
MYDIYTNLSNKINCIRTVKHNNVFFALLATNFGHYSHHQANIVQKFKKRLKKPLLGIEIWIVRPVV